MQIVAKSLNRLFGLNVSTCNCKLFKARLAEYYADTQRQILKRITSGTLVHADETHFSVLGRPAYVWVFTNMHEVAYVYSETREGGLAQVTLENFKGVLVSDFYAVYDSLDCPQQKCLIHLMRDLNDDMLKSPYDDEMRQIVHQFAELLRPIVDTVDRRGLKKHFLKKHVSDVKRFYKWLVTRQWQSEVAEKCRQRLEKNREKLFTFLSYDGVPWNNNNAEHAMKAFAALRDVIEGPATPVGIEEYLILLSVSETCRYKNVDFLEFLRSRVKDINAFLTSRGHTKVAEKH